MTNDDILAALAEDRLSDEDRTLVLSLLLSDDTNELKTAFNQRRSTAEALTGWGLPRLSRRVMLRRLGLELSEDGRIVETAGILRWFWSRFIPLGCFAFVFAYFVYFSGWVRELVPNDGWRLLASACMLLASLKYSYGKAREKYPLCGTVFESFVAFSSFIAVAFYIVLIIGVVDGKMTLSSTPQSVGWLCCWVLGYGMAVNALEEGFGFSERMDRLDWGMKQYMGYFFLSLIGWVAMCGGPGLVDTGFWCYAASAARYLASKSSGVW